LSARHGDFPWIPDPGSARRLTNKRRGELAAEIVKAFRSPEKIEPLIQAEGSQVLQEEVNEFAATVRKSCVQERLSGCISLQLGK